MAKKTVLIADDDNHVRVLLSRVLDKTYNILEARDGEEALRIARSQKPDIILMDIMMPKMDGYSACSAIKSDAELSKTPVIMLTGLGFELNKELARKLGAEDYITKPFNADNLKSILARYLAEDKS